jgi:glycosyltransferase involved in cell wall biosynthesis
MKIFISHASDMLTDCRPHGDGLIADQFIRVLAARGHSIHVAVDRFELRNNYPSNVTLHKIQTGSTPDGLASRLRFALGVRSLLSRLSKTIQFDVIHQLNPVVTGLSLALWDIQVPIVLGPYVPDWPLAFCDGNFRKPNLFDRAKRKVRQKIWQLQHRIASGIILSTPAALQKVDNPLAWERKLHIIPYGVDTEAFIWDPAIPAKTILFVGHLTQRKGVFVLLEAFRSVLRRIPDCKLILAGVGRETDSAKRIASSMENPSNVVFLGHVERDKLPSLMRQSTLCCVPSFGEAFGLVALEAMACGRPIVGTDANGLAHLIADKGGIKIPVGDSDALAEALLRVLENPDIARSMGEHNRKAAEECYAWPSIVTQLEGAYRAAGELNRRASQPGDPAIASPTKELDSHDWQITQQVRDLT